MAIAIDAHSTSGAFAAYPLTWSHTCTGANLRLAVSIWSQAEGNPTVTYNGVSMTKGPQIQTSGSNWLTMFYLDNPATGAHNIVATAAGRSGWGSAESLTGCQQSGTLDASNSTTQAAGPATIAQSLTTIAANAWVITSAWSDSGTAPTASTNVTARETVTSVIGDSNAAVVTPSSFTQTWGVSAASPSSILQMSFAPATATTAGRMFSVF